MGSLLYGNLGIIIYRWGYIPIFLINDREESASVGKMQTLEILTKSTPNRRLKNFEKDQQNRFTTILNNQNDHCCFDYWIRNDPAFVCILFANRKKRTRFLEGLIYRWETTLWQAQPTLFEWPGGSHYAAIWEYNIYIEYTQGGSRKFNDRDDHDTELYLQSHYRRKVLPCVFRLRYGGSAVELSDSKYFVWDISGKWPSGKRQEDKKKLKIYDVICTKTCKRQ